MAETKIAQQLEATCNCCNGRVGHRLLELAETKSELRRFIVPTGVELIKAASEVGITSQTACNCCNGRVGKRPMEELISVLGGG